MPCPNPSLHHPLATSYRCLKQNLVLTTRRTRTLAEPVAEPDLQLSKTIKMFHIVFNFLLQLSLAALALGAPVGDVGASTAGNSWQYGTGGGVLGFIVLVLDILVFSTSPSFSMMCL